MQCRENVSRVEFNGAANSYERALTQDEIRDIQGELDLQLGQRSGNLDPATREAIARAQVERGLTPTGELNPALVTALLRWRRAF
jgi:peptidoglycan hydrolase-like protein with peptidoglycan-binding domain